MPDGCKAAVESLARQVEKSDANNEKLSDTVHKYIQAHAKDHTKLEVKVAENKMKASHMALLVGGIPGITMALILLSKYLPILGATTGP